MQYQLLHVRTKVVQTISNSRFLSHSKVTVISTNKTDDLTVRTRQGVVRGKISKNYSDGTFYSFYGIPYASPPLAPLRFKAPLPPKPWVGILDATMEKEGCIAPNTYTGKIEGTEDCLHLNIYTPEIKKGETSQLKPVIVFIHGGAFFNGNTRTELYGPDFLMTEDIVLVLISYRLGALGWSRLEDGSLGVPGNHGLRDAIMALKWIKENVEFFSGDPNNITLFGQSAGGVMVHDIMLMSSNEELIHKVILHSASAMFHWAIGKKDSMKALAKHLNYPFEKDEDILDFLRKQPVEKIFEGQTKIKEGVQPSLPRNFYPVIEDCENIEKPIISEDPRSVITKGNYVKVPMMIGYTSDEGLLFDYQIRRKLKSNKDAEILTDFEDLVPHNLGFKRGSAESRRIAEHTRLFYFGGKYPTIKDKNKFYQLFGDNYQHHIVHDTMKRHLKNLGHPIYFFRFCVDGKLNFYKKLQGVDAPGATHSDDLCYLFKMSITPPIEKNSLEDITIRRMVKLWTNFARTGNPNVRESCDLINIKWKPIEENNFNCLNIDEELSVSINPDKEGVEFWDKMYNLSPINKL